MGKKGRGLLILKISQMTAVHQAEGTVVLRVLWRAGQSRGFNAMQAV